MPSSLAVRPEAMACIIFLASFHCLSSWFTSAGVVPLPSAMRRRRLPLIMSGIAPLHRRHRKHDRLGALEEGIVNFGCLQLALHAAHAGDHAQEVADRPHLAYFLHLLHEVVEVQLVRLHALAELFDVLVADVGLRLFDQGEDVAHAEDALRQSGPGRRAPGRRRARRCRRT